MQLFKIKLPVWLFLFLAASIRIFLVIHGHGVVEGDESLVGIQAQHILSGERPIYFYGQPYMGSLEAYLIAVVFAFVGSSAWTLRIEPLILSLVAVWLTWYLAKLLAKRASLQTIAERCFIWSATLIAAVSPLYDTVLELRAYGGYIETFVLMLLLLIVALRLGCQWEARYWVLIGFLTGLGFWIDPLVVYIVVAIGLWIIYSMGMTRPPLKSLLSAFLLLPGAFLGFAPGLYWGAQNQWANITYILQQSSHDSLLVRLQTTFHVAQYYQSCLAERVIGGGLPIEDVLEYVLHTTFWYVSLACFLVSVFVVTGAWLVRSTLLIKLARATSLPLLFAVCMIILFCASSAATAGLAFHCSQDFVGRYAAAIMLTLPFFFAATVTFVVMLFSSRVVHLSIVMLLLIYTTATIYSYLLSNTAYLFQSPYCYSAPADDNELIAYLERNNIHFAWSVGWVGNPITFKTASRIIATNPSGVVNNKHSRMPTYTKAVEHADKPSILILVRTKDTRPLLLTILDRERIIYRATRFFSQHGFDVLIITPLNRSILLSKTQEMNNMFICNG